MEIKTEKNIDLTEYGGEGEIIMSIPPLSRQIKLKNELCKGAHITRKNGAVSIEDMPQGDLEVLGVLVYVDKAPFKSTVKDFLDYCDALDDKERGSASRLYNKMSEIAYELDRGDASPLDN